MNCAEARELLDAFVDDELDLRSRVELRAHVTDCPHCTKELAALMALKAEARKDSLRFEVPATLQPRLGQALRLSLEPDRPRRSRRVWVFVAPPMAVAASLLIAIPLLRPSPDVRLRDDVISAHVRSLQADHLTDVVSTDQHTVKPWFQGKVDYAVPVKDFAADGFTLVGGRLDYVDGHPVSAVVYRIRQHVVNVFIWPSNSAEEAPRSEPARGYSSWRWTQAGLTWWLVSDVSSSDAERFVSLLRAPR